jgi:hypothetical protein
VDQVKGVSRGLRNRGVEPCDSPCFKGHKGAESLLVRTRRGTLIFNHYNNIFRFIVSENKTLCHPASVDSLSTSAGTEDHVSMGGFAARKALQVVRNVEKVLVYDFSRVVNSTCKVNPEALVKFSCTCEIGSL